MAKSKAVTDVRYLERATLVRLLILASVIGAYVSWRIAYFVFGLRLGFDRWLLAASGLLLLGWMLFTVYGTLTSSAVAMDVGAHPRRFLLRAAAVAYIIIPAVDPGNGFWWCAWWATLAVAMFGASLGRLQVHANGLKVWDHFIPWRRVYWFDWDVKNRLRLGVAHEIAWLDTTWVLNETISVPPDRKEALDTALRQRVECATPATCFGRG